MKKLINDYFISVVLTGYKNTFVCHKMWLQKFAHCRIVGLAINLIASV